MLVLVRHGQSEANAAGLLVGRADSSLTELGVRQAEAIGKALALAQRPTAVIYTSPLRRAAQTAQAIATGCASVLSTKNGQTAPPQVVVDGRFVELDYGDFDGTALSALPPGLWDNWVSDPSFRPPGGETLLEVTDRVSSALESLSLQAASSDVVIVSHVSPIKASVAWALGSGPELSWRLSLGVASITRIATNGPRGPSLICFNETSHLAVV
jgi:broad specificity phosphatase PhoE